MLSCRCTHVVVQVAFSVRKVLDFLSGQFVEDAVAPDLQVINTRTPGIRYVGPAGVNTLNLQVFCVCGCCKYCVCVLQVLYMGAAPMMVCQCALLISESCLLLECIKRMQRRFRCAFMNCVHT